MKFPGFSRFAAGVALPVSCLRSEKSFGVGEFLDLVPLGSWCRDAGLDTVQILPVNDTGFQPSPYSALSAYALHPLYLRPDALPELKSPAAGAKSLRGEIEKMRGRLEARPRINFDRVLGAKLDLFKRIYGLSAEDIAGDEALHAWMERNPWIRAYALFCSLKEENGGESWVRWKKLARPSGKDIDREWENPGRKKDLLFHAWLQMRLEEQFREAAAELDGMGVLLKGDLPILMSEDSADVWANPDFFRRDLRAGAPPDMFSVTGQNWGFPVYDWDALRGNGFSWWKERLRRADLFYHAYRIDHVLGFFRIWAVPEKETSGVLGFYKPSRFIMRREFEDRGFSEGRLRWLTLPHVAGADIRAVFGDDADGIVRELFDRLGGEDLFLFKEKVGEALIEGLALTPERRNALLSWYRDRALIETAHDSYAPSWYRDGSKACKSLGDGEKRIFGEIVAEYYRDSEERWRREGGELLRFMKESTEMLPCAEDLGVVPDSVPAVLENLEILGLRIPRWVRRYREPGEPYIPPKEYPLLTVCAASVHDTTTLREWWEREADREGFWRALGLPGTPSPEYSEDTAEKLFAGILRTGSVLAMFQLQDFLGLVPEFRAADPVEERINVPGTVADTNWSYRTPFKIEEFGAHEPLKKKIRALLKDRHSLIPPRRVSRQ